MDEKLELWGQLLGTSILKVFQSKIGPAEEDQHTLEKFRLERRRDCLLDEEELVLK